jgi:hypothetical protein
MPSVKVCAITETRRLDGLDHRTGKLGKAATGGNEYPQSHAFDPSRIEPAHQLCRRAVDESMHAVGEHLLGRGLALGRSQQVVAGAGVLIQSGRSGDFEHRQLWSA